MKALPLLQPATVHTQAGHPTDEPTDQVEHSGTSRRRRLVRVVLWVSVFVATSSFVTQVLAFLPGSSLFTLPSTMLLPTIAPLLLVATTASLLSLLWCRSRRVAPRVTTCSAAVALASIALAITIIVSMVTAIGRGGGSVDLLAAVFPKVGLAGDPDSSVTFATVDGVDLHASIYEPPARLDGSAPTLVYVHGGGWISGRPDEFAAKLRWFADQGWLVVSVEYRLSTTRLHTWDESPADLGCALSWTGSHAARYGGDASRLVVMGDSAGGNLAINASYAAATGDAASSCPGPVPVPVAVVAQYPVVDPAATWHHGFGAGASSGARSILEQYVGGTPAEYPQRYAAITSDRFISRAAPPTLIIGPARDHLVPPATVEGFVDRARDRGVDIELATVPFADHGYDSLALGSIGDQGQRTMVRDFLRRTLDES